MTIDQWIASLPADMQETQRIKDANGALTTESFIILEEMEDGGRMLVPTTTLATLLGSVTIPPTYAEVSTLPIASDGGWQVYFDDWKARGIIVAP